MTLNEPMTATDIQYLLKRKGLTQKKLAKKFGVHEMTISRVIHRTLISDRLMRAISNEIGVEPERAFEDYYTRDGRRPRKDASQDLTI